MTNISFLSLLKHICLPGLLLENCFPLTVCSSGGYDSLYMLSSVQLLSRVRLFATPWTAARQASLSTTNSRSLLRLMAIESVMLANRIILCHPLLLPPSIFPSIRVFSHEQVLCIRWPKYCSFSFSISPTNEHPGLTSFRMDWLDLLAEYTMGNVGLDEAQAGIKIARRNINNLRYADDHHPHLIWQKSKRN